jgi:UDP-glucose 4-epimerase
MGHHITVIDNLSCGLRESLDSRISFFNLDLADFSAPGFSRANDIFKLMGPFDAVFHLASLINVKESCEKPELYYSNNLNSLKTILELCKEFNCHNLVLASSSSVYGDQKKLVPFDEKTKPNPVSPYSESKLQCELLLKSFHHNPEFNAVILRYSNAAGSALDLKNGQRTYGPYHVFHRASMTQIGIFPHHIVYGFDYPTQDGTAVRDFIHVEDLVSMNTCAMNYLLNWKPRSKVTTINAGANFPMSVLSVFDTVNRLFLGQFGPKEIQFSARRIGDPGYLVSDSSLIKTIFKYSPRWTDAHTLATSSVLWLQKYHSSTLEPSL